MPDELPEAPLEWWPWIAANPGFVSPHLPYRLCDWERDYGYFQTAEQAQLALDALWAAEGVRPTGVPSLHVLASDVAQLGARVLKAELDLAVAVDAMTNRIESLVRLVNARTEHLV